MHLEEGRILQIDFTAHFGHMTCIHCEVVDILNLKEEQGIHEPYSLFNNPCKLQLQVSFQERGLVLQIIYFDKSEDSKFNPICSNNLTNIPTPYKCMRGTHWLHQIPIGQYFRPQV